MTRAGVNVGIGTHFSYDGEIIEIVEWHMVNGAVEVLAKDLRAQTVRRFALSELMLSERSRPLTGDLVEEVTEFEGDPAMVKWAAASESVRREASERSAHVREVLTGYRSGHAETALRGEPRAAYRPTLPKGKREAAKAKELGIGYERFNAGSASIRSTGKPGWYPPRRCNRIWEARDSRSLSRRRWTSWWSTPTCRSPRNTTSSRTRVRASPRPMARTSCRCLQIRRHTASLIGLSASTGCFRVAPNGTATSRRDHCGRMGNCIRTGPASTC
jgi:hypothetical protein